MVEANKLFDEVLARKDNADTTRATLTILTRHKFLFQLPGNIDKNIGKEDYDLVINDYARAKNLFGKTEVPVSISNDFIISLNVWICPVIQYTNYNGGFCG